MLLQSIVKKFLLVGLTLWVDHEGPAPAIGHHDRVVDRHAVSWQALHIKLWFLLTAVY